jgi:hypothetical protein
VVPETGLDVPRLVEAAVEQQAYPRLRRGPAEGSKERVPFGGDLGVRWQSVQVDQALCLRDGLFVERRDPRGERLDELIEFGVGQSPVDLP